jgi:CheY-like chemotaxis protein
MQPDGSRTHYVFGTDITERKLAEEALIAARDEAERANRAKSRFLSQMSHELRTPLNAILGFGQLLRADRLAALLPAQQQQVDEILRGGRHLLRLINDVLDLGRIETGRLPMELEPVSLIDLMQECMGLVEPLARERQVRLDPLPDPTPACQVVADRMRLKQVMLNLLGNAIKYNREGGSVRLSCRHDDTELEFSVHDTGPGLSDGQQRKLFVAFERLGADAAQVEGTGIGLALSRRLVQAMHGDIGVESRNGEGSRFWVRLPLAAPDGSPTQPATLPAALAGAAAPAMAVFDVLYVEDNEVNAMLMQAMLARLPGLRYRHASHPAAGLAMAAQQVPALVLLDIQLPDLDGFEVLRRLRADERTRDVPVIAVSASAMPDDIRAGLEAGFADYLTKPLEIGPLHEAVMRAVRPQATRG